MYPMTPCGTVRAFSGADQGLEPCARPRPRRRVVQLAEGQSLGPVDSRRAAGLGDDRGLERYHYGEGEEHQETFSHSVAA